MVEDDNTNRDGDADDTGDTGQPDWGDDTAVDGHSERSGGIDTDGLDWRGLFDELFPADDQAALERVQWVGNLLDEAVPVPGTDYRIGLDPLLGIVPVAGDSVATVISLYIIGEAARVGVPRSTLVTMIGLVAVDAVIGSIPILGTIFDAVWKANKWNAGLLERELDAR